MSDGGQGPAEPRQGSSFESYEVAVERLEQIIERLDMGQAGLRETLDLCREGRELIGYCATELGAIGKGFEELKLDQLAAQLDASEESS